MQLLATLLPHDSSLDNEYGELYSSGPRLLLHSWGDTGPSKLEELDPVTGAVLRVVGETGCEQFSDNTANNGVFYCFQENQYRRFAEPYATDPGTLTEKGLLDLAFDDTHVYWVGAQTGNVFATSVYTGRQPL